MGPTDDPERELDRLLDEAGLVDVPPGLAHDVRRRLAERRLDERLERLLDRVPEPEVPAGLARRVLVGLRAPVARPVVRRRGPRVALVALAASLALALGLWVRASRARQVLPPTPERSARVPDEELLLALDALENWDLLTADDLDLLLAGLDEEDELLLELESEEPPSAGDRAGPVPATTSTRKG